MKKIFTKKTFRGNQFGHRDEVYNTVELHNQMEEVYPFLRKLKREKHAVNK